MADNFNFDPKANPLTGVSLADLVAARQAPITTALQQAGPMLQALQQRQQLMALANGLSQPGISSGQSSLTPEQIMYGLNNKLLDAKQAELYGAGGQEQRQLDSEYRKAQIGWLDRRGMPGGANGLTPEEDAAIVKAMRRTVNPLPIDLVKAKGAGAKLLAHSLMQDENYNPSDAVINLARGKAQATGAGSLVGKLETAIGGARGALKGLLSASSALPRTDVKFLNTPLVNAASQYLPEGQDWDTLITGAQLEIARAYAGGNDPGEVQMAKAKKALPDNITGQQLISVLPKLQSQFGDILEGARNPGGISTPTQPKSQQAQQYKEGDIVQNPKNGVRMQLKNGQWKVIK